MSCGAAPLNNLKKIYRILRVGGHQRLYQTLPIIRIAASEGIIEYTSTFCTSSVTVLPSDLANVVRERQLACVTRMHTLTPCAATEYQFFGTLFHRVMS